MIAIQARSPTATALRDTATALVAQGQGILAVDETMHQLTSDGEAVP